jgi:hypothetical protein
VGRLLPAAVAAFAVAAAAAAAAVPAVPPFVQHLSAAKAGPLAYVPTRLPFRYRYTAYRWNAAARILSFRFDDGRFPRNGRHLLWFTSERFGGTLASCGDGRQKTLQLDGNRVYWNGQVAWRCLRGADGRPVKLLAAGPNLPDVALGIVVSSGKRVA